MTWSRCPSLAYSANRLSKRIPKEAKALRAIATRLNRPAQDPCPFDLPQATLELSMPLHDALEGFPSAAGNGVGISVALLARNRWG